RPDVGHQVDVEHAAPFVVGRLDAAEGGDAGVGAEQINRAVGVAGAADEGDGVGFARDVAGDGETAGGGGGALGGGEVAVADDEAARLVGGEAKGEGAADAVAAAGDDHDFVGDLHGHKHSPGQLFAQVADNHACRCGLRGSWAWPC